MTHFASVSSSDGRLKRNLLQVFGNLIATDLHYCEHILPTYIYVCTNIYTCVYVCECVYGCVCMCGYRCVHVNNVYEND